MADSLCRCFSSNYLHAQIFRNTRVFSCGRNYFSLPLQAKEVLAYLDIGIHTSAGIWVRRGPTGDINNV